MPLFITFVCKIVRVFFFSVLYLVMFYTQDVGAFFQEFLSKLSRPLSIPDDKITRWHPKFPLDEVPDILESPLPQPPDLQIYQTAKDVLASTAGKVTPKVLLMVILSRLSFDP